VSDFIPSRLDSAQLLFDLQQGTQIAQNLVGCLAPATIAQRLTDGLVQHFDCALARIWLVQPERTHLKLVASSGLYTRLDGAFATVAMGAYKVGKIAQNHVSFLSNQLAEEPWVRDRDWAIANNIQGFAGYPLILRGAQQAEGQADRVLGVLATFSHQPMAPEFLEVLQWLCTTVAVALEVAQQWQPSSVAPATIGFNHLALSDQLSQLLPAGCLTLMGRERRLSLPCTYLFLQTADVLNRLGCQSCRLVYQAEEIMLEAKVAAPDCLHPQDWVRSQFGSLGFIVECLGGQLQIQATRQSKVQQIVLQFPDAQRDPQTDGALQTRALQPSVLQNVLQNSALPIRIHCGLPVVQLAFTHLAYQAGLQVCTAAMDATVPLLTDDPAQLAAGVKILWVQQGRQPVPPGVQGRVDLSIQPDQLRAAVVALGQGGSWGLPPEGQSLLSDREREMMTLLAQGLRDRDIAQQLFISESTVKFHINNILAKLQAKTRYQALHQVMKLGWID
jgi:DNA-binding CsgD family transcriptional regulator